MKIYAVCGIDTGIGKTVVTGLLARYFLSRGIKVMTQKLVQTGCAGKPEDIVTHRQLMGAAWNDCDAQGLTCPYCFPFAGSPHLAARLAGARIEPAILDQATRQLAEHYELLLLEGAGGLLVPLTAELTQLDYLAAKNYPLILVTSPRLGSLNHTLLSLEAIKARKLPLAGLVYNQFAAHSAEIVSDSLEVFTAALLRYGFPQHIVTIGGDPRASEPVRWQDLAL